MTTYQILFWHDIPIQVRARDAHGRASVALPARFQEAIDRAAMAAGLLDSDSYTALFAWGDVQQSEQSATSTAHAVAAELDARYPAPDWRASAESLRSRAPASTSS